MPCRLGDAARRLQFTIPLGSGAPSPAEEGAPRLVGHRISLEAEATAEQEAAAKLLAKPEFALVPAIGAKLGFGKVDTFDRYREVRRDIVADIRIQLTERLGELRIFRITAIDSRQELVAPIIRDPRRKTVFVEDQRRVERIGQAEQRELVLGRGCPDIEPDIAAHQRIGPRDPETGIAEASSA